jgi:hypothetical protein
MPDERADGRSQSTSLLTIPWVPVGAKARKGIAFEPAGGQSLDPVARDTLLIAIGRARCWMDDLVEGRVSSFQEIAKSEGKVERHIRYLAPLAYLSPASSRRSPTERRPRTSRSHRSPAPCRTAGPNRNRSSESAEQPGSADTRGKHKQQTTVPVCAARSQPLACATADGNGACCNREPVSRRVEPGLDFAAREPPGDSKMRRRDWTPKPRQKAPQRKFGSEERRDASA